jgi:tRNA A37 methylthiotransferase MiaB
LGREKRLAFHRLFVDQELAVLVENRRDKTTGLAVGMSANYIKALFATTEIPSNQFVRLRISQAREDLVFGEVINYDR